MNRNDREDVAHLAEVLKAASLAGRVAPKVEDLPLRVPYRRRCNLLRKFPQEIATLAGLAEVTYQAAEYVASDSGPFGRYSNKRGRYHAPRVSLRKGEP